MVKNAVPYHAKPYKIPFKLLPEVRKEIYGMVEKEVLQEQKKDTDWAAPTFAIPKKAYA